MDSWLSENLDLVARDGVVLDVASGRGRHALALARRGWRVHAIDRDQEALAALADQARAAGYHIETTCDDLERDDVDLGVERYRTIIVFRYLHRPLMPVLIRALERGGVLLYQTFTIGQRERGHPRNPLFLLGDGELPQLVQPLDVLRYREGEFDGALIASIAARKP